MKENLVYLRKQNNYTQKQVAHLVGISENQYQRLELGKSDGSIKVWQQLKEILGAESIDYLLIESENTRKPDDNQYRFGSSERPTR